MSYAALLKHRCTLEEMDEKFVDGVPSSNWTVVSTSVKCFLDLNFIRRGKDPMWTPEAGRVSDRNGVLFVGGSQAIRSGMRVTMTKGPSGKFLIEGAVDEAWTPTERHHVEVGVVEIPQQITKGQGAK